MNGYFQLIVGQGKTGLMLYPPTDGGEAIDSQELLQYLAVKQIPYDARAIGVALVGLSEPTEVTLNLESRFPEQEVFFVRVSPDRLTATARFYPPSSGGNYMDEMEIRKTLQAQKIVYGIDDAAIHAFCQHREYCKDIILAKGKPPVQGHDYRIEYYFNTDLKIKPTLNEDGSVDFRHLNVMNQVKKGDVLARLFQAEPGELGYAVQGDVIRPGEVKRGILRFSKRVSIDETKTILTSEVNGHVKLVDGQVFVSDVYEVENVDNSTGNVEYEGSVRVNQNVLSGFRIKAKGNVEVAGVVEGACIEADGDIIIARGMNGMNKGVLKAGGKIISKFLENTTAEAGGYIETESILHCNISSKSEVILTGRRAFIAGGHVCAANRVIVKTLGSSMGADTVVEVGADPTVKAELQQLQKQVAENQKNLKQMEPVLAAMMQKMKSGVKLQPEQVQYVQKLVQSINLVKEQNAGNMTRIEELNMQLEESTNASVEVSGEVFPGTKIIISDSSMTVGSGMKYCRFVRTRGEVVMAPL